MPPLDHPSRANRRVDGYPQPAGEKEPCDQSGCWNATRTAWPRQWMISTRLNRCVQRRESRLGRRRRCIRWEAERYCRNALVSRRRPQPRVLGRGNGARLSGRRRRAPRQRRGAFTVLVPRHCLLTYPRSPVGCPARFFCSVRRGKTRLPSRLSPKKVL